MAEGLENLAQPRKRQFPVEPRGSFSFFPIGDLALVAPVELPGPSDGILVPAPNQTAQVFQLEQPNPVHDECSGLVGSNGPDYDRTGRPPALALPVAVVDSALGTSAPLPLERPGLMDVSSSIGRQSQLDELLNSIVPLLPMAGEQSTHILQLAPTDLKTDFLLGARRPALSAGAKIVTLAPPRPLSSAMANPAIPPSALGVVEPAWRRGIPMPMPGLAPRPQAGKRIVKELAPWFVPARPKPPVLSLEIQPTPAGWQHLRQGFVANSVKAGSAKTLAEGAESDKDLAALATALDEPLVLGIDHRKPGDSPWPKRRKLPIITPITDWWMTCSNQVRVMVIALPLLVAIAIRPLTHGSAGTPSMEERPSAPVRSAHANNPRQAMPGVIPNVPSDIESRVEKATKGKMDNFKQSIISRAAVEIADDFQSGLDNWEGNAQLGPSWSYDRTGFIRPRALGIYTPSMPLADYAFEFLAKMDQRAISWVFRASDLNNYYVMKLVDKTGGVSPQMALVHYAVIEGREGPRKEVVLPIQVYKDTLFRIRMDIQGPHFSVQVQGSVVDYWKDSRLKAGGVGFFASRGEESRVRWVQVTHQDDMLGKLCAFLAPYAN